MTCVDSATNDSRILTDEAIDNLLSSPWSSGTETNDSSETDLEGECRCWGARTSENAAGDLSTDETKEALDDPPSSESETVRVLVDSEVKLVLRLFTESTGNADPSKAPAPSALAPRAKGAIVWNPPKEFSCVSCCSFRFSASSLWVEKLGSEG